MNIKDINTSKCLFDPKKKGFEKSMIDSYSVFDLGDHRILTYIILVYDLNSEIRRNYKEYTERKVISAQLAGFKTIKDRFTPDVEKMLIGENDECNKAIVQYVYMMNSNDYKLLFILEDKFNAIVRTHATIISTSFASKDQKLLTDMKEQIEELEEKLFGGKESIQALKALYAGTEASRLRIRKEDEMRDFEKDGLTGDYEPYPGYRPKKVVFAGDKIPI